MSFSLVAELQKSADWKRQNDSSDNDRSEED